MAAVTPPENIAKFLEEKNFLMLATARKDGSPQVTPVWYLWENGHILINTENGRAKAKNIKRDPRVAVAIQSMTNPYQYVQIKGRVVKSEAGATGQRDISRLSERYTGSAVYQGDPEGKTDRISYLIEPESFQAMGL